MIPLVVSCLPALEAHGSVGQIPPWASAKALLTLVNFLFSSSLSPAKKIYRCRNFFHPKNVARTYVKVRKRAALRRVKKGLDVSESNSIKGHRKPNQISYDRPHTLRPESGTIRRKKSEKFLFIVMTWKRSSFRGASERRFSSIHHHRTPFDGPLRVMRF